MGDPVKGLIFHECLYNRLKRDNFTDKDLQRIAEVLSCTFKAGFALNGTGEEIFYQIAPENRSYGLSRLLRSILWLVAPSSLLGGWGSTAPRTALLPAASILAGLEYKRVSHNAAPSLFAPSPPIPYRLAAPVRLDRHKR
ncbi:MAG: hypothetical protein LBH43_19910 [Treponema sp.]|nr:hypothetical protein [Treponema sp.]